MPGRSKSISRCGATRGGPIVSELRCVVFRGLPKELEEELNKFFESTPCEIQYVLQSESSDLVTITVFFELDTQETS